MHSTRKSCPLFLQPSAPPPSLPHLPITHPHPHPPLPSRSTHWIFPFTLRSSMTTLISSEYRFSPKIRIGLILQFATPPASRTKRLSTSSPHTLCGRSGLVPEIARGLKTDKSDAYITIQFLVQVFCNTRHYFNI